MAVTSGQRRRRVGACRASSRLHHFIFRFQNTAISQRTSPAVPIFEYVDSACRVVYAMTDVPTRSAALVTIERIWYMRSHAASRLGSGG